MKMQLVIVLVALVLLNTACEKETQPAEENDNELITTVQLDFTKRGSDDVSTFVWEDSDGPGGELPVIDTIRLDDNSIYDVEISLWNKARTPAENITAEVKGESTAHRLYYEASAGSGILVDGLDSDTDGMPLGVTSVWTTADNINGNVTVVLRHYPDGGKAAEDAVNSPKSSTDAGAIFEVEEEN